MAQASRESEVQDDTNAPDGPVVQIDIVSDVMCPWCIVGFRQLEQALGMAGAGAYIRWHPFELNPDMPAEGQNLREHITQKYGSTPAQSDQARAQLQALGQDLGIVFNYDDNSRIVNTFAAHQLLGWAQTQGLQHPLKMALFKAHFTQGRDVSRRETLLDIAAAAGLDADAAAEVLSDTRHAEETRAHQQFWTSRGVTGVPSMVFDGRYMLTGAQGAQTYAQMLARVISERDAA